MMEIMQCKRDKPYQQLLVVWHGLPIHQIWKRWDFSDSDNDIQIHKNEQFPSKYSAAKSGRRKCVLFHLLAVVFIFHWDMAFVHGVTCLELQNKEKGSHVSIQVSVKRIN
jgi:hypothetical protein